MNADATQAPPEFDIADELAVLNRFRLIEEFAPAFHQQHWQSIAFISAAVSALSQETADLRLVMGMLLLSGAGHDEEADAIRNMLRQIFEDGPERATTFVRRMEAPLRSALKLSQDPELPGWLHHAHGIIAAGFAPGNAAEK